MQYRAAPSLGGAALSFRQAGDLRCAFDPRADFWCGLLFVAIGVAVVVLAHDYRLGIGGAHGAGITFRPLLGGRCSHCSALTLTIPAMFKDGERLPRLQLRPLVMVLLGIAAFGVGAGILRLRGRGGGAGAGRRPCRSGVAPARVRGRRAVSRRVLNRDFRRAARHAVDALAEPVSEAWTSSPISPSASASPSA